MINEVVIYLCGFVSGCLALSLMEMLTRWIEVRLATRSLAKAVEEFNKVAMTQGKDPLPPTVARGSYFEGRNKLN